MTHPEYQEILNCFNGVLKNMDSVLENMKKQEKINEFVIGSMEKNQKINDLLIERIENLEKRLDKKE